jgi:hypothetical protein
MRRYARLDELISKEILNNSLDRNCYRINTLLSGIENKKVFYKQRLFCVCIHLVFKYAVIRLSASSLYLHSWKLENDIFFFLLFF